MEVVGGSIPLATTSPLTDARPAGGEPSLMLKFLSLVVVILLLKAVF